MKFDKSGLMTVRAFAIWGGVTFGVLAVLTLAAIGAEVAYGRLYNERMFPGIRVLNVRLDGLSKNEARDAVQKAVDTALNKGLHFRFRGADVQIDATVVATGADASRDLLQYDVNGAIDRAFSLGRDDGWLRNVSEQVAARARLIHLPADVSIDREGIQRALASVLKGAVSPASDATFAIVMATGTDPLIHIENERDGLTFDATRALDVLATQAQRLQFDAIPLEEKVAVPTVRRADLEPLTDKVLIALKRPSIMLTYEDETYQIPTVMISRWMTVRTDNGRPRLALNGQAVLASIHELAPTLEQETKNGSLVIKDGKISSFVPGTQGVAVDLAATLGPIEDGWLNATSVASDQTVRLSYPIVVQMTSGSLLGEDPQRLGIKEIIGVGRSNFSGSPVNRRKNIRLGAEKVNGTIIPPGGEFSLLTTLGEIDGANGWLPELVIKGDKTTPEFGGGLCQIGTTVFRGALASGLKITERRNHSYRVRYYEPAGTDATIYDPSPDMKFLNDTAHAILINAYLKGDEVIFEFWGTKDGRTTLFKGQTEVTDVTKLKPRVWNVTTPPPMKLVETLDLAPGQKKCTESAHNGADAEFTYDVTYADGSVLSVPFTSHYRPWQAVCLVGVEQLSAPPDASVQQPLTP